MYFSIFRYQTRYMYPYFGLLISNAAVIVSCIGASIKYIGVDYELLEWLILLLSLPWAAVIGAISLELNMLVVNAILNYCNMSINKLNSIQISQMAGYYVLAHIFMSPSTVIIYYITNLVGKLIVIGIFVCTYSFLVSIIFAPIYVVLYRKSIQNNKSIFDFSIHEVDREFI